MGEKIVEMKGISKSFGGVQALEDVQFSLEKGEVHALIGENGAGKSTLMKILLGMVKKDVGTIFYKGNQVDFHSPNQALTNGISMIHQEISLMPSMDVSENIWFGREKDFSQNGLINKKKRYEKTKELLEDLGVDIDPKIKISEISVAETQLVELCRAVSYHPSVIIMDEPTSALSDKEVEILFRIVRRLSKEGVAIIYISHKLDEIYKICSTMTILRDGHFIKTGSCSEISREELIYYICGRKTQTLYEKEETWKGDVLLEVRNLNRGDVVRDVNFKVRKGEILGMCGLMGAGRSEILRAVFGIDKKTSGQIFLNGKEIDIKIPEDAVKAGIAMVNEDRLRMGIIKDMNILGNTTIAIFDRLCNKLGFFDPKIEVKQYESMEGALSIKCGSPKDLITSLSGGNQQKVVIARWISSNPTVFFLDEPTRGIDVGAKSEIYKIINELAKRGMAVVMISSELPEILSLSDRILVVRDGTIVYECDAKNATQDLLMKHSFG